LAGELGVERARGHEREVTTFGRRLAIEAEGRVDYREDGVERKDLSNE
jgi:hypothetical protein